MKRKQGSESGVINPAPPPSLAALDAALDLLACETFGRLQELTAKFESAAGVKLNDGVVKHRWGEACMRYYLMKSMDDLTCSASALKAHGDNHDEMSMEDESVPNGTSQDSERYKRPMPQSSHPGAVVSFGLDADEEAQWRRWTPKVNDLVVVELAEEGVWPGKIIDKNVCFQGRSMPRGNHFYGVRVYSGTIEPSMTVKARMVPFYLRSSPPLMAATNLLSAYNHANEPTSFDALASNREAAAAHARTHPGVGDEDSLAKIQVDKDKWKKFVNWLMDERRVEKLRALCEERGRRLREVTKTTPTDVSEWDDYHESQPRKRRVTPSIAPFSYRDIKKNTLEKLEGNPNERGGIFKITSVSSTSSSPTSSAATLSTASTRATTPMSAYIRPALSAVPYRAGSPRRADRRRNGIFTGLGEFSPRARGGTYTPPRVLPNGDETAVFGSPSPAPSLKSFDFISPLGPVKLGRLSTDIDDDTVMQAKSGSNLEAVLEEGEEDDRSTPAWTLAVSKRRSRRAGSAPVENVDKAEHRAKVTSSDDLVL